MRLAARWISAAALAACAACGPEPAPAAAGPHVILVVLDTLRADRLGAYGYDKPTSPNLDAFAAEATLYTRAVATAPWTLPSHASMLTGLYPYEHGARTYELEEGSEKRSNVAGLADDVPTLAEVLRAAGYRTGAVTANEGFLKERYGLARGFDHWDNARGPAREINRRALDWLGDADRPTFLLLNYMDTHRPYECRPRPGFETDGTPEEAAEVIKTLRKVYLANLEVPDEDALLARASELYDTSVANLDAGIGELFAELRARGVWDDAVVVVTSDHGEFLGEHGLIEHSKDVYQETVWIPLVVKRPGQGAGATDAERVSLVHVPGLILEHVPGAPEGAEALTRHWPRSEVLAENYFSRLHDLNEPNGARFDRIRRALFDGDWKWIDSSDGASELYDLSTDPREGADLRSREAARAEALAGRVRARLADARSTSAEIRDATDAELEVLRRLGYAGDAEDE